MRRVSLYLTMLIVAALLLAACGGQETSTSIPNTDVPPVTAEATSTSEATTGTATAETAETTTTPAVPVTGENSPSRLSNLIGFPVMSQGGDEIGTVQDLVLDFDSTMVTYVVVDADGRTVLVPWDQFQVQAGVDAGQLSVLSLLADDGLFNNAPDFDVSTLPEQGQPAAGWDATVTGYWQGGGAGGTGDTTTQATNTPSTGGTGATALPATTATATTSTGTGTGAGTGGDVGQGVMQIQGVMLATDVLGATVVVSPQGNDQGTGSTGAGTVSTSTPSTGTGTTATPDTTTTATATTGTGTGSGTGTGTGTSDNLQGTVEDLIIEPMTGDMQYLVVQFGTEDRWIPVPIGFLRWDAANNQFVLMINENALQNAPAFSPNEFPDTSTSGWDQDFSTFWQSNGGTGSGTGTGGTSNATVTPTP